MAVREWGDVENFRNLKLGRAVLDIFFQHLGQHLARIGPVLLKEICFFSLEHLSTFPACPQRSVKSDMTQQIKRIGIRLVRHRSEERRVGKESRSRWAPH